MDSWDQKFFTTRQPELKLRIALERFSQEEALPEPYREYLQLRSYAAAALLAKEGQYSRLQRFLELLEESGRRRLLKEAPDLSPEARAILMGSEPASRQADAPIPALLKLWMGRMAAKYPSTHRALSTFAYAPVTMDRPLGTDGETVYYDPRRFTRDYARDRGYSDCIHMVLHCLFFHLNAPDTPRRDGAADYAANHLQAILFPEVPCDHPGESTTDLPAIMVRGLYADPRDDHRFWRPVHQEKALLWQQAAEGLGASYGSSHFGYAPGSRQDRMEKRLAARYDFSGYLRRFSEIREEYQLDPDSIDYIPYDYGLRRYGKLPLIEPLEYQEVAKVRDMVIAIDTSGSCTKEIVQQFLAQTREILTGQANFFQRMNVCFLQCDSMIQDVAWIRSREDWLRYEENITIQGRGGTDFTPVFDLVANLRRQGSLRYLRGLIYFTDGDGVYPRKKPAWETALVAPDRKILELPVPSWCRILCLNEGGSRT